MKYWFAAIAAIPLATAAVPAAAHHSFAMFDQTKKVTVTGEVSKFLWTNPHSYIQLVVTDENGKVVEWSLEMGAPTYLYANGWRPRTLKPGDRLTVTFNPLRSGKPGGVVLEATTADGKTLGNVKK